MCVNGIRNKVMYQVCVPRQPARPTITSNAPSHWRPACSCNYCASMVALSH